MRKELETLEDEKCDLEAELREKEREVDGHEEQLAEVKDKLKERDNRIADLEERAGELQEQINGLKEGRGQELGGKEQLLEQKYEALRAAERRFKELERVCFLDIQVRVDNLTEVKDKLKVRDDRIADLEGHAGELQEQINELKERRDQELGGKEQLLEQKDEALRATERRIKELVCFLDIQVRVDNLTNEAGTLLSVMNSRAGLPRIHSTMGSFFVIASLKSSFNTHARNERSSRGRSMNWKLSLRRPSKDAGISTTVSAQPQPS